MAKMNAHLISFATACAEFNVPEWVLRRARTREELPVTILPSASNGVRSAHARHVHTLRIRRVDAARIADQFHARQAQREKIGARGDTCSVEDAAEITGVHEETVRRWIRGGELPAQRIPPDGYLINVRDLNTLLSR